LLNDVCACAERVAWARTNSVPRTPSNEAEHFAAVVFSQKNVVEIAFARFVLIDGRGVVVVYSKRFLGATRSAEAKRWLEESGAHFEEALMNWRAIPSQAQLDKLPQSASAHRQRVRVESQDDASHE
jgi:hypothetical protein